MKEPYYILTKPNSGRHLYNRGWLGLIPIVGFFVGAGLVVLGLVRYKDRKLVLIGLAGMLFTITIYSSLFYYFEFSESGRQQKLPFVQKHLNEIVKELEFYNLQNGYYPDSLQELKSQAVFPIIDDPLAPIGKNSYPFNYTRTDSGYVLFSSGMDRKPNTADDIFPTISVNKRKTGD